ncbi:hypothetical protein [Streptomyces asiaticus]
MDTRQPAKGIKSGIQLGQELCAASRSDRLAESESVAFHLAGALDLPVQQPGDRGRVVGAGRQLGPEDNQTGREVLSGS